MTNVLIYNFFQYYQMDVNNLVFVFNEIFNNSSSDESSDDEVLKLFRGPIVKRPRVRNFEEVVNLYSNEEFRQNFRLNRFTFNYILNLIANRIESNVLDNHRHAITAKKQFLIALWYFATPESYRSICGRFDVGKATGHRAIARVTDTLLELTPNFMKWPQGNNLDLIRNRFNQMGFPDTIGVIETYIKIPLPKENEMYYICRKKFPAIILQGVCDQLIIN
jgi:hypothetical protein